jgi:nitrogen fixation protein NifU and related proteins
LSKPLRLTDNEVTDGLIIRKTTWFLPIAAQMSGPYNAYEFASERLDFHSLFLNIFANMADEADIYEDHVLDHYEDPYHRGSLGHPTHSDQGDNPLCGDTVQLDLRINADGKIIEAAFEGDGCVISQASASMLVEEIEGKTIEELNQFTANDMLKLFGAKLTPNRQKCCLLSWRVLQSAVHSPVDDAQEMDKPSFGGPTLGEES